MKNKLKLYDLKGTIKNEFPEIANRRDETEFHVTIINSTLQTSKGSVKMHFTGLLAFLFLFHNANAILLLQIPGVSLSYPNSGTVAIEFLDFLGNVQYSIQGEYAVPGYDSVPNSQFFPPKLLKKALAIKSIRIKSGEVGMTVKVYGSAQAKPKEGTVLAVPAIIVLMKSGFSSATSPLKVPFDQGQQLITLPEMDVNFPNKDQSGVSALEGFYIQQIEIQLQRNPNPPKEAVYQFVPLGSLNGGSQSSELGRAISGSNGPSAQPPDSVMVGNQPMVLQQQPASSSYQTPPFRPPPSQQSFQFANSPNF